MLTRALAQSSLVPRFCLRVAHRSLASTLPRPQLVSPDLVDRVPWVAMKHPDFQRTDDPDSSVGDIRGVRMVTPMLFVQYSCNYCHAHGSRRISKRAYNHGVVVIKCEKCKKLHLISDKLSWFNGGHESKSISEVLQERLRLGIRAAAEDPDSLDIDGLD